MPGALVRDQTQPGCFKSLVESALASQHVEALRPTPAWLVAHVGEPPPGDGGPSCGGDTVSPTGDPNHRRPWGV